jgi:TolB-like protein
VQWALAYAAGAFALLQGVDIVAQRFGWPETIERALIVALAVGFFVVLVVAWYHGERGAQRVSGTELLILALLLTVGGGVMWRVAQSPRETAASASADRHDEGVGAVKPSPAAPAPGKSIAVLPFVNMSGEAENEFFSDGLSEEILNSLARIDSMQVVGRTSSFQFKGKNEDLRAVGEKLGVANVLEGSVRRSGDHARITAQLVRASDGFHLWSQTYDRTLSDILAVQLDIAEHVAGALDVVMDDQQRERMRSAGVKNVDAFIAYQKGLKLYEDAHDPARSPELIAVLRKADIEFARAVELEPGFALAHFMSTDLYIHLMIADSTSAAERTAALNATLSRLDEALRTMRDPQQRVFIEADRQLLSSDWRGLVPRLEAAYASKGCGEAIWSMQFGETFGFGPQVEELAARLIACDPLNLPNHLRQAEAANWAGKPQHALELVHASERTLGETSSVLTAQGIIALLALGRVDEARAQLATIGAQNELVGELHLMVGAASGEDRAAMHKIWEQLDRSRSRLDAWGIVEIALAKLTGDQAAANRLAAKFDARPIGPMLLAVTIQYCQCGAPFDLDAAPNLKARIAEAGLPWPPRETIRFPKLSQEGR